MHKMHILSCVALTLALVTDGAPISGSKKETQQQVEQLLMDLQLALDGVNNRENLKLPLMLTCKFYMPRKATELKHLQCLVEELKPLEEVLTLAQRRSFHLGNIQELISNINVTAQKLQGPETSFTCDYNDATANIVEFLNKWITFCQSIISTLI